MKNTRLAIIVGILLVGAGAWYYSTLGPTVDTRKFTDNQVQKWMDNDQVNAIEFLASKGQFYSRSEDVPGTIDREFAQPLVKQLQDDIQIETVAVLDESDPKRAIVFMIDLKKNEAKIDKVKSLFAQADEAFPGLIMRQYGYSWMFFQFLAKEEAAALNLGDNWTDVIQ